MSEDEFLDEDFVGEDDGLLEEEEELLDEDDC
jgi:hypothetical protein